MDKQAELWAVMKSADVSASVATRARIVSWYAEGRLKKQIAALAGVSRPTVNLWLKRYAAEGVSGLVERSHAAPREQVPARIRARILAATRTSPPADTELSHWSSRQMAAFIKRTEGVYLSQSLCGDVVAGERVEATPTGNIQGEQGSGVRGESR